MSQVKIRLSRICFQFGLKSSKKYLWLVFKRDIYEYFLLLFQKTLFLLIFIHGVSYIWMTVFSSSTDRFTSVRSGGVFETGIMLKRNQGPSSFL